MCTERGLTHRGAVCRSDNQGHPRDNGTHPRDTGRAETTGESAVGKRGQGVTETTSCGTCGARVPASHHFCGQCGGAIHQESAPATTAFFGSVNTEARARLTLIRGEGFDGVHFDLTSRHLAGRSVGDFLFSDDGYLSTRHAEFYFEDGDLHVSDQGTLNGVYRRITHPMPLQDGDLFLAGEELLEVQLTPFDDRGEAKDGTHFFASPMPTVHWRVRQILEGGRPGRCMVSPGSVLTIGREGCHLNFPHDRFISGQHCQLEFSTDAALLTDLSSRNGSFVRIRDTAKLVDGDHLFMGRQLLRVEIFGEGA